MPGPSTRLLKIEDDNPEAAVKTNHKTERICTRAGIISPQFYPAYCFPLSAAYNTWARISILDVHHVLRERSGFEGQGIFFYHNHPLRWVRLVGIVVALDLYPTRFVFVLDDSSGATIDVTCERPRLSVDTCMSRTSDTVNAQIGARSSVQGRTSSGTIVNLTGLDVGSIVKIKGSISVYRNERQINLERLMPVNDTKTELLSWKESADFKTDVLSKPWRLTDKEVRRAKVYAEKGANRSAQLKAAAEKAAKIKAEEERRREAEEEARKAAKSLRKKQRSEKDVTKRNRLECDRMERERLFEREKQKQADRQEQEIRARSLPKPAVKLDPIYVEHISIQESSRDQKLDDHGKRNALDRRAQGSHDKKRMRQLEEQEQRVRLFAEQQMKRTKSR